jgi:hypothetical protein
VFLAANLSFPDFPSRVVEVNVVQGWPLEPHGVHLDSVGKGKLDKLRD